MRLQYRKGLTEFISHRLTMIGHELKINGVQSV